MGEVTTNSRRFHLTPRPVRVVIHYMTDSTMPSSPKTADDILADAKKALAEHDEAIGRHMKEALKLRQMIATMEGLTLPVTLPFAVPTIDPFMVPVMPLLPPWWVEPFSPIVIGHGGNCACFQCCPITWTWTGNTVDLRGIQNYGNGANGNTYALPANVTIVDFNGDGVGPDNTSAVLGTFAQMH